MKRMMRLTTAALFGATMLATPALAQTVSGDAEVEVQVPDDGGQRDRKDDRDHADRDHQFDDCEPGSCSHLSTYLRPQTNPIKLR